MKYNHFGVLSSSIMVLIVLAGMVGSFVVGASLSKDHPRVKNQELAENDSLEVKAWQEKVGQLEKRVASARKWLGEEISPFKSVETLGESAKKHRLVLEDLRVGKIHQEEYYLAMPVVVQVYGPYINLREFIDEVEGSTRAQTITRLSLAPGRQLTSFEQPSIKAVLEMTVYGALSPAVAGEPGAKGKGKQVPKNTNIFGVPPEFFLGKELSPDGLVTPGEPKGMAPADNGTGAVDNS